MIAQSNGSLTRLRAMRLLLPLLAAACTTPDTEGGARAPAAGPGVAVQSQGVPQGHEMLNAVLWQKTSAEYAALARQAYRLARRNLDRALADPSWTAALEQTGTFGDLPPAIIFDLDETVIDNTPYEVRIVLEYGEATQSTFDTWCEKADAAAVPGVLDFLRYAQSRQVAIFYVSARPEAMRGCTIETLRRLGVPLADAADRLRLGGDEGKTGHRRDIAGRFRLLLLVGDNLEDFVEGSRAAPEERKRVARRHDALWGSKWIILPNPMYGHWEAAFYGFDYAAPHADKLRRKYRGLETTR